MNLIQEFKKFAMRGSVVDLAVGIIIGAAFSKIVTSFVNDVITIPKPTKLKTPKSSRANTSTMLPCIVTPNTPIDKAKIMTP